MVRVLRVRVCGRRRVGAACGRLGLRGSSLCRRVDFVVGKVEVGEGKAAWARVFGL